MVKKELEPVEKKEPRHISSDEIRMVLESIKAVGEQLVKQKEYESKILLIKVGLILSILLGATVLALTDRFSAELTTALYVAAFGYLLGTIK